MPLIQTSTIGRKLQRSLRLVELPDAILAPEIVPVILVEDATAPLSDEERGCMGSSGIGPVALENPFVGLTRAVAPSDTYDLRVTEAHVSSTTAGELIVAIATEDFATAMAVSGQTSFDDMEIPGRPSTLMGVDTLVGLPNHRTIVTIQAIANTTYRVPLDLRIGRLGLGDSLVGVFVGAETVNVQIRGGFRWTEGPSLG